VKTPGAFVFASVMFVIVAGLVFFCGCKPACTAIDLAHEACVIIPMVDQRTGQKYELKIPGKVALEYLNTGKIGVERCPTSK
jgi:hypothetical protein